MSLGHVKSPPLALYIHLPWCIKKCPYCDFNSHGTDGGDFPEQAYIKALIRDLDFALTRLVDRKFVSIFLGGGTPSLFSDRGMGHLLSAIMSRIETLANIEITLEANPGSVDAGRFAAFREAGINRLSIGIQSFNDAMLKRLGRVHDSEAAVNAIKLAKAAGFERINLDLMYGLPEQHLTQAMDDLEQALAHNPKHLSWYQLTIEPNTVFYKHTPKMPADDEVWTMQEQGRALIQGAGFENYEISAYAKPGYACKHNLNYWQFGDYLGIGAGAHSKITNIASKEIVREIRHRLPERYINLAGDNAVITETKLLSEADRILEFMMNALRLTAGFEVSMFEQTAGLPIESIKQEINSAVKRGWLESNGLRIKPTSLGQNYLNDLLQGFMYIKGSEYLKIENLTE